MDTVELLWPCADPRRAAALRRSRTIGVPRGQVQCAVREATDCMKAGGVEGETGPRRFRHVGGPASDSVASDEERGACTSLSDQDRNKRPLPRTTIGLVILKAALHKSQNAASIGAGSNTNSAALRLDSSSSLSDGARANPRLPKSSTLARGELSNRSVATACSKPEKTLTITSSCLE